MKLHLKEIRFSFYEVCMNLGWWEITAFLGFQMKKLRIILNSKRHTYTHTYIHTYNQMLLSVCTDPSKSKMDRRTVNKSNLSTV